MKLKCTISVTNADARLFPQTTTRGVIADKYPVDVCRLRIDLYARKQRRALRSSVDLRYRSNRGVGLSRLPAGVSAEGGQPATIEVRPSSTHFICRSVLGRFGRFSVRAHRLCPAKRPVTRLRPATGTLGRASHLRTPPHLLSLILWFYGAFPICAVSMQMLLDSSCSRGITE
jgi:hypothetical protein